MFLKVVESLKDVYNRVHAAKSSSEVPKKDTDRRHRCRSRREQVRLASAASA